VLFTDERPVAWLRPGCNLRAVLHLRLAGCDGKPLFAPRRVRV